MNSRVGRIVFAATGLLGSAFVADALLIGAIRGRMGVTSRVAQPAAFWVMLTVIAASTIFFLTLAVMLPEHRADGSDDRDD